MRASVSSFPHRRHYRSDCDNAWIRHSFACTCCYSRLAPPGSLLTAADDGQLANPRWGRRRQHLLARSRGGSASDCHLSTASYCSASLRPALPLPALYLRLLTRNVHQRFDLSASRTSEDPSSNAYRHLGRSNQLFGSCAPRRTEQEGGSQLTPISSLSSSGATDSAILLLHLEGVRFHTAFTDWRGSDSPELDARFPPPRLNAPAPALLGNDAVLRSCYWRDTPGRTVNRRAR